VDNGILWKWALRLIWVGSIVFFQALELRRYVCGESYRPFFALYTAVLVSLFLWFLASMMRNLGRRRNA
jgi:hypothetical protein